MLIKYDRLLIAGMHMRRAIFETIRLTVSNALRVADEASWELKLPRKWMMICSRLFLYFCTAGVR